MDLIIRDLMVALAVFVVAVTVLIFLKMGNFILIATLVGVVAMILIIILRLRPTPPPPPPLSGKPARPALRPSSLFHPSSVSIG